jgi:hypothetical protein
MPLKQARFQKGFAFLQRTPDIADGLGRFHDWDDLRIFLAVARTESLSGAGRRC